MSFTNPLLKMCHLLRVELRDDEMLEEQNVWKVLSWATEESRIHKLDDLVRPEMAFLWSRPQQLVNAASKIDPLKARKPSAVVFVLSS